MPLSDAPDDSAPINSLLAALPPSEMELLRSHLEPVSLIFQEQLYDAGDRIGHVYFPSSGVLSLICPADGSSRQGVEVGVVGFEGMAGLSVFLGQRSGSFRCVVQVPGRAVRIRSETFHECVGRNSQFHGLLLRYTHVMVTHLAQSVACNTLHPIEKRLCRWLLTVHDRTDDRFPLTHEFLSTMLGVRRASVTVAARTLREAGLIRYGRGHLTVLNRPGLEAAACGCHRIVRAELDRTLGNGHPLRPTRQD